MRKLIIGLSLTYIFGLIILYFFQDELIFREKVLPDNYKFEFEQPFKELWIEVNNSNGPKSKVNALYFYADSISKKGLVVYYHGNANNLNRSAKFAGDFTRNGYDILMIDYRGYGKSRGQFSEKGLIDDAEATYNYAKKLFPEKNIVVYGKSLGSGIATQVAAKNKPKYLLLETPYFNFADISRHFFPFIPYELLLKYKFRTDQFIKKVPCPVHLFHGDNDELIYYESSLKLANVLGKNPAQIVTTVKGGEHRNLSKFAAYHMALDSILRK
jgi:uncharacterized protein